MQHAGLQYGQGAVNSHQSPPFAHADISQNNGGTTTSSLRQFRKKDGTDKNSTTDLSTTVENSHIARVPPHNHYPARPNEYFRYQHQYPDYNSPYKETPAQVKYSEIAETPPQTIQHVDHIPPLQKHKEVHKDFMDMCNISQQTHMKQNYSENLTRQQSYPPDAATVHHQYLHKEPQVHSGYKPESQYQQYPQIPKYNMPSQCRKYAPPPPENDFLAKLQRINPSMARSIMSDHHIRESQGTYPTMDQNRMYQNQRYYPPSHIQNNISYNYQPYNYPSSCNYKHPEYTRSNQMGVGGTQYPALNPHTDRSISPRNLHMMNYGTSTQKISPTYSQYNPPEYAQHYQHRRTSLPQEYYQQSCRANPYMTGHQISPEPTDNRGASGGLRHFIENWAEEDPTAEITPIFKDNIRIHNTESNSEQVLFINSSDIPQCLENVSLVPTENGQFIIKTGALDNSVVRIKETTENDGEKTVNLQIVEKSDCLVEENSKTSEDPIVPYQENQIQKDCDETTQNSQNEELQGKKQQTEHLEKREETASETSVIVSNEVSVIKDMPIIEEEHLKLDAEIRPEETDDKAKEPETTEETPSDILGENHIASSTRRTQRIFSVDDIINNIGSSPSESRRNSLQFIPKTTEETTEDSQPEDKEETGNGVEYRNAISVEDDNVILEIGGAWVQLHINHLNGTKVLSVVPLSDSLVIDANGNYQDSLETNEENLQNSEESNKEIEAQGKEITAETGDKNEEKPHENPTAEIPENLQNEPESAHIETNEPENLQIEPQTEENLEDIFQSEIVIGEDSIDNDVFVDLSVQAPIQESSLPVTEEEEEEKIKPQESEISKKREEKRKSRDSEERRKSTSKKLKTEERKDNEERSKLKKSRDEKILKRSKSESSDDIKKKETPTKKHEKIYHEDDVKKKDEDYGKLKKAKKLSPQSSSEDDEAKKRVVQEEILKFKRSERRSLSQNNTDDDENKKEEMSEVKIKKHEKKIILSIKTQKEQEDEAKVKYANEDNEKLLKKEKKLTVSIITAEAESPKIEEFIKSGKKDKKLSPIIINTTKGETRQKEENEDCDKSSSKDKKTILQDSKEPQILKEKQIEKKSDDKKEKSEEIEEKVQKPVTAIQQETKLPEPVTSQSEKTEDKNEKIPKPVDTIKPHEPLSEDLKHIVESPTNSADVVLLAEEMITLKQLEETKEADKLPTKAAKKLYIDNPVVTAKETKSVEVLKHKKSVSKLEETVNKIKSMKEKVLKEEKTKKSDEKKSPKSLKKVTFNLEADIREINKEEMDKKKLSLEEYNSRKRRSSVLSESEEPKNKIMEDTVTSTGDVNDEVIEQIEPSIKSPVRASPPKKSPPKMTQSSWEDDTPSPESPIKEEVQSTTNRKCIIDVNEFNIKPIESVSTPSPVSSSQFSYHSEDDSLQVYKDVVDSKLNSLNIKIPKLSKPKPVDRISVLLDRFLNKGSLTYEELEEVKKFIEIKRKMLEEEKKLTYEVRGERDYKDLKLHFKKVPEKRKKKRFRNLYAEESSDESDSSRSEKNVGDYSVYQRDSQGVPKLIFKRKSGLPQPFVKLERSQAVELLAKKRKLY